jgi:recombining binding protein suppressor of hairless
MPHRFSISGTLHSIIIVDMPDIATVINALSEDLLPAIGNGGMPDERRDGENGTVGGVKADGTGAAPAPPPPSTALAGRTLPLLFVRPSDGIGYHSGRTIALENVFAQIEHGTQAVDAAWLSVAQQAVGGGQYAGWQLRVM